MKSTNLATEAKIALLRRNQTITKLAAELGVTRTHLSLVLHGRHNASDALRRGIAERIGVTVPARLRHRRKVTPVKHRSSTERASR